MIKVLFLLKYRGTYDDGYSTGYLSSGLYNSARMVSTALNEFGINNEEVETKMVELNSYNLIDAEAYAFQPDIIIIEAFWVPPTKIAELIAIPRYANVKWIIRNHSNIPFLSLESKPFNWIPEYCKLKNVFVGANSTASLKDIREAVAEQNNVSISEANAKVIYFPNYYLIETANDWVAPPMWKSTVDISCFGAMRPLKNQVAQAIAAIKYAREVGKQLRFHINGGRVEFGGAPVLANMRALFSDNVGAELVEYEWMPHDDFISLMKQMDISLQVSFSETFNIVTADAVSCGVPVVVSDEISWVDQAFRARPTITDDIVKKIKVAHEASVRGLHSVNLTNLNNHNKSAYSSIESTLDYALQYVAPPI